MVFYWDLRKVLLLLSNLFVFFSLSSCCFFSFFFFFLSFLRYYFLYSAFVEDVLDEDVFVEKSFDCQFHIVLRFVYIYLVCISCIYILTALHYFCLKKLIEVYFNRSNTFLLYFYDTYDINLSEKVLAEVRFIQTGQMCYEIS